MSMSDHSFDTNATMNNLMVHLVLKDNDGVEARLVIEMLTNIFNISNTKATALASTIQCNGHASIFSGSYELADQKLLECQTFLNIINQMNHNRINTDLKFDIQSHESRKLETAEVEE